MKEFNRLVLVILLVILTTKVKSENPCGTMFPSRDSSSWGIGFIHIPANVFVKGITTKTKQTCYVGNGVISFGKDNAPKIDEKDMIYMHSKPGMLLKVFQIKDTKYKICVNSNDEPVWVDFDDLSSKGIIFRTYLSALNVNAVTDDFFQSIRWVNIGVNLLNSCLYLRTEPSIQSDKITCLNNNNRFDETGRITHMEIIYIQDDWARVIAREYVYDLEKDELGDGCAFKVVNEYTGFVKAVDDNGRPNIWYAMSGY